MKLSIKRMLRLVSLGSLGIAATLYAIYQLSQSATRPETADPQYIQMLILTLIGLGILLCTTLWQIVSLIRHLRQRHVGARLSLSFALRMLFASLIPVSIVGAFAWLFLSYDLGKTFNSRVTVALEDALQLTRTSITLRARQAVDQTRSLANIMINMSYTDLVSEIEPMRRNANAIELAVFDHQGNLVAFTHQNLAVMTIAPPSTSALLRISQEQEYFEFATDEDGNYIIRVLSDINKLGRDPYYLQVTFAMPEEFNSLANSVSENYQQYRSYSYLQPHITTSLLLVLGLILALTVLTALWLSSIFGDQMTRPVRQLIRATRKVTSGDFSTTVTDMPNNDLGTLGNHFNIMLLTLRDAEAMNNRTQDQLTEQNNFLGTILDNLTSGVLTFDWQSRLQLANQAAAAILSNPLKAHIGRRPQTEPEKALDSFDELMCALAEAFNQSPGNWHQEVTLSRFAERKTLICRGSRLPGQNSRQRGGQIIVFEDVTEFQHNQRNAAWEEVARRLAHEIKNPLTPIRLQGERLQRKLGDKLSEPNDQRILQRATHTIISQVDAMQQLVSDFSQFAKPVELRRQKIDLNALLREIAELYSDADLTLDLQPDLPIITADPIQLRQVMLNLTKNAQEAGGDSPIAIQWRTRQAQNQIVVSVEDDGPGFPDLSKDPFEPYVTNKSKGTGLGLAIVKKIISEHHGSIQAGPSKQLNGAKISFSLPL